MWRYHHHATALHFYAGGYPQPRLALQSTVTAAHAQRTRLQRCSQPGKVQEANAVDTALERLPVSTLIGQQFDTRVEKTPQPSAFYPHFEDQRFITLQRLIDLEHAVTQGDRRFAGLLAEVVGVIFARCIEQMISEPSFVGSPEQRQQQQRQPPPGEYAHGNQHRQAAQ